MKRDCSPWGVWHLRRRGDVQVQDSRLLLFGRPVSGAAGRLGSDQRGVVLKKKKQHHRSISVKNKWSHRFRFLETKSDWLAAGRSLPHVVRRLSACVCLLEYKPSCLRYGKIVSEVQNSPRDMYLKLYSFTTVMFPNTRQHCALD